MNLKYIKVYFLKKKLPFTILLDVPVYKLQLKVRFMIDVWSVLMATLNYEDTFILGVFMIGQIH